MSPTIAACRPAAVDYGRTLILSIEVSNQNWVLAAQVPGLPHTKAKRTVDPEAEALMAAIAGYRSRAAAMGRSIGRVIAVYEAGWSAFGSRDGLRGITWKCTLSSLPAYQSIVVCAARSLTALMPSCCFGHCSLGCEASRAFVRWFQFPTRLMRMPDGVFANGQNLSQSASV